MSEGKTTATAEGCHSVFGDKGQDVTEGRLAVGMGDSFSPQLPPSSHCVLPSESVASCRSGSVRLHGLELETE